MSCNNSTVDDYMISSSGDMSGIKGESDDGCWPWTYLTEDDIQWANEKFDESTSYGGVGQIFMLSVAPFGTVGSCLSIISAWNKAVRKREIFFIWMLVIGVLDLLYASLTIPNVIGNGYAFPNVYQYSYVGTRMICVLWGLVYGLSICSDLVTLALTMDRYRSLHKPVGDGPPSALRRLTGVCLIALLSVARTVRFGLEYTVDVIEDENGTTYDYMGSSIRDTEVFAALVLFTDVVLPFLLLSLMTYYTSRIAIIVIKRHRKQGQRVRRIQNSRRSVTTISVREAFTENYTTAVAKELNQAKDGLRTSAMLRLLLILVFLYTLNQLGYTVYAVSFLVSRAADEYSFEMTRSDLERAMNSVVFMGVADCVSDSIEVLSRSMHFYMYFCLSSVIRGECKRALRRK